MNSVKAIRGVIRRKMEDWIKSIDNEALRNEVADSVIVSGGCIASLLLSEPVNDYDVYLNNRDTLTKLMKYYIRKFADNPAPRYKRGQACSIELRLNGEYPKVVVRSAGVAGENKAEGYEFFEVRTAAATDQAAVEDYVDSAVRDVRPLVQDTADLGEPASSNPGYVALAEEVTNEDTPAKETGPGAKEKNKYRPIFLTTNAITLSDGIQLVTRFFGTAEEIHKNFDYVHCTNWYSHKAKELHFNEAAMASLLTRDLRYVGSLYPICSVIRARKFLRRGWSCNAGQFMKMLFKINALDLDNIAVLEEQLIGVDQAYFMELISVLRKEKEAGKQVDQTYIMELIDKMF